MIFDGVIYGETLGSEMRWSGLWKKFEKRGGMFYMMGCFMEGGLIIFDTYT